MTLLNQSFAKGASPLQVGLDPVGQGAVLAVAVATDDRQGFQIVMAEADLLSLVGGAPGVPMALVLGCVVHEGLV
jgi:hypothetical protein